IPLWGVFAMAQSPADAQIRLAVARNVSKSGKEDKGDRKDGGAVNDRAGDGEDNAELTEEMRQRRQLIERPEARVNQLYVALLGNPRNSQAHSLWLMATGAWQTRTAFLVQVANSHIRRVRT